MPKSAVTLVGLSVSLNPWQILEVVRVRRFYWVCAWAGLELLNLCSKLNLLLWHRNPVKSMIYITFMSVLSDGIMAAPTFLSPTLTSAGEGKEASKREEHRRRRLSRSPRPHHHLICSSLLNTPGSSGCGVFLGPTHRDPGWEEQGGTRGPHFS